MKRVDAFLLAAFGFFAFTTSSGAGLSNPDVVDYVLANPATGQAALIMSVDVPLSSEDAERRFNRKITSYIAFVQSGQLYRNYPQVKDGVPVRISIVFESQPPAPVLPKLRLAKVRLEQLGYQVQLRAYDPDKRKSVDFEP